MSTQSEQHRFMEEIKADDLDILADIAYQQEQAMREEMEKMREKTLREDKKKQKLAMEEEKKKMMEEAKQRNEKFQKEKREKKQQERMNAIKLKETELRNIRNIKLAKKKRDAAMHAKRKADLRVQEKILANKKSQWATEKMEMKKMQREQILEHHMDAKSCANHVSLPIENLLIVEKDSFSFSVNVPF